MIELNELDILGHKTIPLKLGNTIDYNQDTEVFSIKETYKIKPNIKTTLKRKTNTNNIPISIQLH